MPKRRRKPVGQITINAGEIERLEHAIADLVALIRKTLSQAWPEPIGEILTEEQCAKLLGVTRRTLRIWRRKRALPHSKITSREIRYTRSEINQWLTARRVAMVAA